MLHRITTLGEARFLSPLNRFVEDGWSVPEQIIQGMPGTTQAAEFELAGPRAKLYFDPKRTRTGIVTCGGLCPGMNNVIRSLFNELHHAYGVPEVLGFRGGFKGLDPAYGQPVIRLTPEFVDDIHRRGGTVLGTSRGRVEEAMAVENLARLGVKILFVVGGDGTQRGGNDLFQAARQRGHELAVVGIPKTVDNDVAFVSRTFGYLTAVEEAAAVLDRAHVEARSVQNGIALIKVMGRHAGFIAVGATVASQEVNFCLIPEVPFNLDNFLAALKQRMVGRSHAVIVVAEGVGQEWLHNSDVTRDASGNLKLGDIGPFLRGQIETYFKAEGMSVVMRYFDPSYHIRSGPANSEDSILCDLFARNAVHAAMAGKTGLVIGFLHDHFIHVPIELLASRKKSIDPAGPVWRGTLAATGQPEQL
ncbi:MAG TPA: ATP-dependent 6-phosphofructokinase [Candidatus Acidoferrales bacterium]|nr:ATP-dependent 6-phosphofructokinase [Candidatus Acidoferrales bacterium]